MYALMGFEPPDCGQGQGPTGVGRIIMEHLSEHEPPSSLRGHWEHHVKPRSLTSLSPSVYRKRINKSMRSFHHQIKRAIGKKLPFKNRQLSHTSSSETSMENRADRASACTMPPSPASSILPSLPESKDEDEGTHDQTMTEDEKEMSKMGVRELLAHVLKLRDNERVIAGHDGVVMLRAAVAAGLEKGDAEAIEVDRRMRSDAAVAASLTYLVEKGRACRDLISTKVDAPDSGWTLCSEHKGTKTYCQDAEDGRGIRVRVEGELPVSPMEMLAVIREFQLYKRWMPLCTESRVIMQRGCESTFYIRLSAGLLGWDVLGNGTGCDCMVEDGSVVLLAGSIEDGDPRAPNAPRQHDSLTFWRVAVRDAKFRFKVRDESSVSCTATFVLDPRMSGFSDLFNWLLKKIAGRLFDLLTYQGSKVLKEGHKNYLTQAMVANPGFYRDFMGPRHWWVCRSLGKTQAPKVYSLLGLTTQDAEAMDPYPGRHFSPCPASSHGPSSTLPPRSSPIKSTTTDEALAGQDEALAGQDGEATDPITTYPPATDAIKGRNHSPTTVGVLGSAVTALVGVLVGGWVMYVCMTQRCAI